MRDETIDTEGVSSSDFDLDAFLRENNFLADEDVKNAEKDVKAKNDTKQTSKQSKRRTTSKRPTSDEDDTDSPMPSDAATNTSVKNTTNSVKTLKGTKSTKSTQTEKNREAAENTGTAKNTEAAEVAKSTTSAESIKSKKSAMDTESTGSTEDTKSTGETKSTKGTKNTGDTKSTTESAGRTKSTRSTRKADPNATMSYEMLGADYPEFPLIEDNASQDTARTVPVPSDKRDTTSQTNVVSQKTSSSRTASASLASSSSRTASSSPTSSASSKRDANTPASVAAQLAAASEPAAKAAPRGTRAATGSSTKKSRSAAKTAATDTTTTGTTAADALRAHPSAATSAAAKKRSRSDTTTRNAASPKRAPRLATLANPNDFHPAELVDNDYHIRGGGRRHNRRSPIMVILIAVVIIAGSGLLGFFLWDTFQGLLGEKPVEQVITLSASETRSAIDSEMPVLLDYIWNGSESAHAVFLDNGWNVVMPGRDTSDNPDPTATGSEVIHLATGVDPSVLDNGYYASEFDGYDYDELQASFNGAWMLDISQGDLGAYAQLKYVNFASASLADEFQHLRELQGLVDESSVVVAEDIDGFGNSYVRGYLVIEEITYYWEIIGIAFGNYYGGQDRRSLPETAVYVKCRVASFDFYGAASSPPATT